jgi:MFS family permease
VRAPRPARAAAPALSQLRAGVDAARRDPVVLTVIVLATVFFFGFAGAAYVGVPALAKLSLGADSRGVGLLMGASGAGALLGAGVAGTVRGIRRPAVVGSFAILGNGLLLAASGAATTLWTAAIPLFFSGLLGSAAGVLFVSLVQTRAPAEARGRVLSLLTLGQFGLYPLSYGLAGWIGDVAGPGRIVTAGGLVVALSGVIGLTRRVFWRTDQ